MAANIWELDELGRSVAPFDKDAKLIIPVDISKRLVDIGFGHASNAVEFEAGLEEYASTTFDDGVIFISVQCTEDAVVGSTYKMNVRFVTTDGQQDDIPLYLRITD